MRKKNHTKTTHSKVSNHPNYQRILIFLTLVLVISTTLYYLSQLFKPQKIQIAEVGTTNGSVTLSITPEDTTLHPDGTTLVNISYDSPTHELSGVQVEINYDPEFFLPSNVTMDPSFPTSIIQPTIANGKIKFVVGVSLSGGQGLIGNGKIATLEVKALKVGTSTLSFDQNTMVTAFNQTSNVLKSVTNTTLEIASLNSTSPSPSPSDTASDTNTSPSPSPSPSASPSPSPSDTAANTSPSPSPSPSPSLSPSPSPSAPAAEKPTSPNNLKYNCYSNGTRITLRWDEVTGVSGYTTVFDQNDGDNDQTKNSTRPEIDLDIKSNTLYTWKVSSNKNSVSSDQTIIKDIKCSGDTAGSTSPSPSPSPIIASPTPAPSQNTAQKIANIFKPKSPSPTPKPSVKTSPSPLASFTPASPISSPGSLSDIFATPPTSPSPTSTENPGLFNRILLGWRALLLRIVESFGR